MSEQVAEPLGGENAAEAIESYHTYLASHPDAAAEAQGLLHSLSIERHLTFGGDPFSRYLRPHLITPGQYRVIQDVVSALASAMIKLRRAVLLNPQLLAQLDLTPQEHHLALLDPGFEEPSPSARLDSFWSEHNWQFVEMNAESPAAIAYEDILADLFLELPVLKDWQSKSGYRLTPLYARPRFMKEIESVWREFRRNRGSGFSERPNVAIVDWEGVPTASEFELFRQYFEERGLPTRIVDPRELTFEGGRLRAGDFEIDIYYKRVLTSELLEKPDAAQATIDAYEAGQVCLINSFRAKLLHKKMSFALLQDAANAHLFTRQELEVIGRHIPWTRKVAEGYTTYNGEQVDLVPFIVGNRENLVLKPNDEYGGKGVAIGWVQSQQEWEAALAEALESSFVVQWVVQLDHEPYPFYDASSGVSFRDLTADLDPFLFGTDTQGVLTRLSAVALLNVTAGTGSVVPTMVVENRA